MAKKSAVEKNNRRKRMVARKGARRQALRATIRDPSDRKLRMSRIALRDLASMGQVPGVVKSSW